MRKIICHALTPRYFEVHGGVGNHLTFCILTMAVGLNEVMHWVGGYVFDVFYYPVAVTFLRDCPSLFFILSLS